jgi:hypothetical protein
VTREPACRAAPCALAAALLRMADAKRKDAPEADEDALAAAVEAAKRKAAARRQTIWQEDPQARGARRLHGARPAPNV